MRFLEVLNWFFQVTNEALDVVLAWLLVPALLAYPVIYFIKGYKKAQKEQKTEEKRNQLIDLFWGMLILLLAFGAIYVIFWVIPQLIHTSVELLSLAKGWEWIIYIDYVVPYLRWAIFTGLAVLVVSLYGKKNGENRWRISTIGHVAVLFLGWIIQRWIGILFISFPILAAFYAHLYSLAIVTLPTADPDDRKEKHNRFLILISYLWGIQRPLFVTGAHAWKDTEIRIPGDSGHDFPIPGLIWGRTHEAVGITGGANFIRVAGPGLVFTRKRESPLQVMDLRVQTRSSEIDVVSKDGINFRVTISAAFRLDPEKWDSEKYGKLRAAKPFLRGWDRLTSTVGNFPFSDLRIRAAISTTSIELAGDKKVYWDRWALHVIEDAARQVISQKKLDELWRSKNDQKGDNALVEIANELYNDSYFTLRAQGILLVGSNITKFSFSREQNKPDKITDQQISTWESEWIRKREEILAEAQAESDRVRQEARADAETVLLSALADGLQKTGEIHPNLPRYVIATRFLSALQNYIHLQPLPEEGGEEYEKKFKELQNYLKFWQEQSFPVSGKEKK